MGNLGSPDVSTTLLLTLDAALKQKRAKAEWTPPLDAYFIELMIERQNSGQRSDNGFKKEAWRSAVSDFNKKFGLQFDVGQLKSRYNFLKRQYNIVKTLLGQSGFIWDEAQRTVVATDDVWNLYVPAHPEAKTYKTKGLPLYDQLGILSEGTGSEWNEQLTIIRVEPEEGTSDTGNIRSPDVSVSTTPLSTLDALVEQERAKAEWTPPRDAYFVELMIEQQNIGNRSSIGFKKEAWESALSDFNRKFGLQFDVGQLKSHYSHLMRQHNIVKALLDQRGFSWDEVRQTVIADDDFWDRYLSAHPKAKTYRTKGLPLYDRLCILYPGTSLERNEQISSTHLEALDEGASDTGNFQSPDASTTPIPSLDAVLEEFEQSTKREISVENLQRNKRRSTTPTTSCHERRMRTSTETKIADAFQEMVSYSKLRAMQDLGSNEKFSYEKCLEELQQMEDLNDKEFVNAVNILKDEKNAIAFLSLKGPRRLTWLKSMC
eukprot:TRINITY_DN4829_c0_g1_i1.p1 TRINITY_DN4829_c0_g1~~TRINITY_DN4829_c0_g1_i1.p1  ORF type:complete len:517 (-),score=80.66 TRINITY_DN4829_c0_g1_i1:227-1693(-)